jgi:hypothetical protein
MQVVPQPIEYLLVKAKTFEKTEPERVQNGVDSKNHEDNEKW